MKKFLLVLAAVFCCAMAMTVFGSCSKDEVKSDLVGVWTEKNDLFTDVLTLNEDGLFNFQSHTPRYSGSGSYVYDFKLQGIVVNFLTLHYTNKESQTLEIRKLNSNTLELTDRYGYVFHFKK